MDPNAVHNQIKKILSLRPDQEAMIQRLGELIKKEGIESISEWRNSENKTRNTLMHELVEKNCPDVIRYLAYEHRLDIGLHRELDGKTPIQLVQQDNVEMENLLNDLERNQMEQQIPDDDEPEQDLRRKMNIVWVDLEMTSIEDPKIMECAVIITDKHLKELDRAEWVVHYDQNELDTLGSWHQEQFKSVEDGGNGLFQDCIKSTLTEAQVEEALLKLIQRYCPEKECPLAGSSIHIDKDVLKQRMPKVHDYVHYRIIDVSSFRAILRRWDPVQDQKLTSKLSDNGNEHVSHRAMDDIKYSIALMKLFRPLLTRNSFRNRNSQDRPYNNGKRRDVPEASALPNNNRLPGSFETNKVIYYADEKALQARLELEKELAAKPPKLDKKFQEIYNRNPHLRETFIDRRTTSVMQKGFTKDDRFLDIRRSSSSSNIAQTVRHRVTTDHWGARKLMLTDIEFLTNYGRSGKFLVIYVGAAPGLHINALSDFFPDLEFVLIDSKKVETKKTAKIHIRSLEYMDDIVKEYAKLKKDILLICDIHTFTTTEEIDENMLSDIKKQVKWHSSMKPAASLLTFSLPRNVDKVDYFKGDIVLEPWASRSANSCRLVAKKDAHLIQYSVKVIKSSMAHFQNVMRTTYYEHDLTDSNSDGLDHCYDCRSEIFILRRYLEKIQQVSDERSVLNAITKMSTEISNNIHDRSRPSIVDGVRTLAVIPKK